MSFPDAGICGEKEDKSLKIKISRTPKGYSYSLEGGELKKILEADLTIRKYLRNPERFQSELKRLEEKAD